ncbi:MAG: AraC family transcriptional regulator [Clostridia bacterium]|nr:AraC family transcriptional regulator [Clostridia bacterium]MBR6602704.1 AraC family transcriptional regulator [Clostridia bacterium]
MPKMYYEKFQINLNGKLKDINPLYFKSASFIEGMGYPSRIRNFTVITYVKEGCGTFEIYGKRYEVHPGQVYIIPQGVVTSTKASDKDPWKCISVGFDGEYCRDFERIEPVFDFEPDLFDELLEIANFEGRKDIATASLIMRMYSAWMPHDTPQNENDLAGIKLYIEENFMNPISVEEIAREHSMDRTYLSKLFKRKYGKSLKEYIIYVRLKEARLLLGSGKNVTEAALLCGFNTPTHFSRIYKKYYCDPPTAHKESKRVDRVEIGHKK